MIKSEKESIERLVTLRVLTPQDKRDVLALFRKYINQNAVFCLKCDASVRIMFNQFKVWWNNKKNIHYTFIKALNN